MKKRIFRSVLALIEAVILGLCFAVGTFFVASPNDVYATTSIQFTYDGAANGVDPNGNAFSSDSIITEKIVADALDTLGWAEKYDAGQVCKSIVVSGSYPQNIIEKITGYDSVLDYSGVRELTVSEYYPTVYSITLYDDFSDRVKKSDLVKLLGAVVDTYEQSFYTAYSHDYVTEPLESVMSSDGHDYTYQIELLNKKVEFIKDYCNELYDLQPAFASGGVTFKDLALKCTALQENKLARMEISVTMNGLTQNEDSLINEYEYTIETLELDLDEKTESYNAVNALIESYERDSTLYISSGDSFIKVSSNSGETYDALVAKRVELSQEISSINSEISEYRQRITDVRNNVSGSQFYTALDSDIEYVETQITAIKSEFDALSDKYDEKYVIHNAIEKKAITKSNNSIFSGSFIVTCIKCIGPFGVVAVAAILVDFMVAEIKKSQRKAKRA